MSLNANLKVKSVTATVYLFAHPIHPSVSRYLATPTTHTEDDARRLLGEQGYIVSDPRWVFDDGLLADEDPTHREHAIRLDGDLYGWMTVEEDPPDDISEAHRQDMAEWARRTLAELEVDEAA